MRLNDHVVRTVLVLFAAFVGATLSVDRANAAETMQCYYGNSGGSPTYFPNPTIYAVFTYSTLPAVTTHFQFIGTGSNTSYTPPLHLPEIPNIVPKRYDFFNSHTYAVKKTVVTGMWSVTDTVNGGIFIPYPFGNFFVGNGSHWDCPNITTGYIVGNGHP